MKLTSIGFIRPLAMVVLILFCCAASVASAVKTQFHPVLYVSGDYTDNKDQTSVDKNESYHTRYGSTLLVRFVEKNAGLDLVYNPEYIDRESDDEDGDSLDHNASLKANLQASPRVAMDLSLNYDGHKDDVDNESWAHTGEFNTTMAFTRKTRGEMSMDYLNAFERRRSTGQYQEHTDHGGGAILIHQFGTLNQLSLSLDYRGVDYEPPVQEDYDSWAPGIYLTYWINPCWGVDVSANYEKMDYDILDYELNSATGVFRFVNCISPHFKFYSQYKHIYTDRNGDTENNYLPSLGIDWDVTEDTGISLGVGYLYQEWDDNSHGRFFLDADVFKRIDFSRHANVILTAATTIDPSSDDGVDLGFLVQYQGGFLLSWDIMETLSADFRGAYTRDEFTAALVDRTDNTFNVGTGLTWSPWCWGSLEFAYTYEDFRTDSILREDYQEHRGTLTLRLHPAFDWVGGKGDVPSREAVEERIYGMN